MQDPGRALVTKQMNLNSNSYSTSCVRNVLHQRNLGMMASERIRSEEKEDEETYLSSSAERKSRIRFSTIETRQFNRTLDDNPACRCGPPVSLDWDYIDVKSVSIDEYEAKRKPRSDDEIFMSSFIRRRMMSTEFGYTVKDLEKAEKSVKKIQRSREKTKYEVRRRRRKSSLHSCSG